MIYSWRHRTTDGGARRVNMIGNYYKGGPATTHWKLASIDGDELKTGDMQKGYISGNKMVDASGKIIADPNKDNWAHCTNSKFNTIADVRSNTILFPLTQTLFQ